jgi:putative phosphoesterase
LHAGDIVATAVLDELGRLARLEAVRGNMDEPVLRERLPKRRVVEIGGVRIGLVHDPGPALGRVARLLGLFPDCEVIVYGHTHVPELTRFDRRLILNPGSPTSARTTLGPTMIELSIVEKVVEPVIVTP